MDNQNIQIGIDLGTTNSEAAINNRGNIEIIKNIFGDEYTPSVFGIDKSKNKVVGKKAYERLYKEASDEEFSNNKAEIKRLMGTSEKVHFTRVDQKMSPEEISAEILKSLKEDILRKYPEFNTQSAVITVPAYFSTLQAEATKRAANIAGFEYAVLLQEPIAASIAYGFNGVKNENWLIYDLGGGTFDVALISSKDGALSVIAHNGDNFLGGKDFDWLLVEKIMIPRILDKYKLTNFDRGNEKYKSTFSKLKYIAETSKICLSQYDKTNIEIESIGKDDEGKEIYLSFEFSSSEFEKLIKPLVDRTIELSADTIKDSGIKQSAVHRIVLVGGPTQMPYIRSRLERELKIVVDTSVDPLTVVARGACIFAVSQRIPDELVKKTGQMNNGSRNISLNFDSLTSETEEAISGIIPDLKDANEEYYIQIQGDSGFYSGPKIKLRNGKFFDTLALEPNKNNLFWVYLFNKQGSSIPVYPDSFSITHGLSISGAPIPHSIGVAIIRKDYNSNLGFTEVFEKFFDKGSTLPLKKTESFKTVKKVRKGDTENVLPIKIYEGESDIPNRNLLISRLEITGERLPYDLPEGTEVAITIEVNESREVFVEAYIPTIDLTLKSSIVRIDTYAENVNIGELETDLKVQVDRTRRIEETCSPDEKSKLDNNIDSVTASLKNAHLDQDEKRKAHKQLKDLKMSLDHLEKEKELPQLEKEFTEGINDVRKIIDEMKDEAEKNKSIDQLNVLKKEGEKAISGNDKHLLCRVNEQVRELGSRVLFLNPVTWAYYFRQIIENNRVFINEQEARYYIDKGKRAIELGDVEELKRCVHNLLLLLPPNEQQSIKNSISGITR